MSALSVVVAVRGRSEAFRRMLASLAAQTLPPDRWELVVVDDGSSPADAAAIAREIETVKAPHRLVSQSHGGPAKARNTGVRAARGGIVHFLNSDVIVPPGHLERHLRAHEADPDPMAAFHGETRWHPDVLRGAHMRLLELTTFRYDWPLHDWEKPLVLFCTSSLSAKRALLLEHPFDESFPEPSFEDTELAVRLVKLPGFRIALLEGEPVLHWHYHSPRALLRRSAMNGRNAARMIAKVPEFHHRLVGAWSAIPPRRRLLRAAAMAVRGRGTAFWREVELAVYLRSYWKSARLESAPE